MARLQFVRAKAMMQLSCGLAAFVLFISPTSSYAQNSLFKLLPERLVDAGQNAKTTAHAIALDQGLLKEGDSFETLLELPDETLAVRLSPLAPKTMSLKKGQAAWYTQFTDKIGGDIFVYRESGIVRATINRADRVYQIRTLGDGRQILESTTVKDAFPLDHPEGTKGLAPPKPPERRGEGPRFLPDCADPIDGVDTMVGDTPAARSGAGGTMPMEVEVNFAIARANLANANSSVFHRLNLVYTGEVSYVEPAGGVNMNVLLPQLQST